MGKRIVSIILSIFMMINMMPSMYITALAVEEDYYIVGEGVELGSWDPEMAQQMLDNGDGTFSYEIEVEEGQLYEFKILPTNVDLTGEITAQDGGNFQTMALASGTASITFAPSKTGDSRISLNGLVWPTPAQTYYVVGDMNDWDTKNALQMTMNDDGTYSATFENITGKNYEFKVAQDAPTYGMYKSWGDQCH